MLCYKPGDEPARKELTSSWTLFLDGCRLTVVLGKRNGLAQGITLPTRPATRLISSIAAASPSASSCGIPPNHGWPVIHAARLEKSVDRYG
jgi:hypothetical protein